MLCGLECLCRQLCARENRLLARKIQILSEGATPHTRGSTLAWPMAFGQEVGYPAYAGIDPKMRKSKGLLSGLPRIRGDRPRPLQLRHVCGAATPHTRGSTCEYWRGMIGQLGYPAYAGIDPRMLGRYFTSLGLPRIRGDRPPGSDLPQLSVQATPHTRGSTLCYHYAPQILRGYPAYAGIDPSVGDANMPVLRLPRIRGDRPTGNGLDMFRLGATPHTRGSTHAIRVAEKLLKGYPAYAGIDPAVVPGRQFADRLPRIRGDRPACFKRPDYSQTATPHTRGSTFCAHARTDIPRGYPAYAGIDRSVSYCSFVMFGLPRIRGDRPVLGGGHARFPPATPHTRGSTLMRSRRG